MMGMESMDAYFEPPKPIFLKFLYFLTKSQHLKALTDMALDEFVSYENDCECCLNLVLITFKKKIMFDSLH